MWLYPKVVGFNPPERWGHSACFFEGVVYVFGVRIRRPSTSPAVFVTPIFFCRDLSAPTILSRIHQHHACCMSSDLFFLLLFG